MRIARFSYEDDIRFGVVAALGEDEVVAPIVGDPLYAPIQPAGDPIPLADVRLLAPVIPRSKIIGVGRNYAAHAAEMGNEVPENPLLFLMPNTAVIGPGEPIVHPPFTENMHFEGELCVVIGRVCKDVPPERVPEVIFGYTCGNDVTARDIQKTDGQWARAKGFDTSCPLGPWIETELDPADLAISCTVNGELKQDSRTSLMVRDVIELVTYVSSAFTLLPGDVIMTGTPAGVGPLVPGDEVAVTIEGIGTLTNRVVSRD
jgi:2-keto-4-pentenoate hydratase/2-oxohepta-3-ene-1,7-dioic acid hydratase in catechol pathway